ncbi:MAG TPA: methyltransferase domain-containing protein [Planctomycetota bacterium]|nr:methyltransferase domain-containing protein [Planctomycetota bacterium]
MNTPVLPPPEDALAAVFVQKYGTDERLGWGPAMRRRFGYHNPDDHYEAVVRALVDERTRWLDVGCGRELFPSNRSLAAELAARCARLVGVDPDATLDENRYVHERVRASLQDYDGGEAFDLVTLRMVAEHVTDPPAVAAAIARALAPGGFAVVYTVDGWSPMPLLTRLAPMRVRHVVKRFLWRTEEKDTFPTAFRMNSRARLRAVLGAAGLEEVAFAWLDDCRTLGRFRAGQWLELCAWRALRALGLRYPERCLLGVYRKAPAAARARTE